MAKVLLELEFDDEKYEQIKNMANTIFIMEEDKNVQIKKYFELCITDHFSEDVSFFERRMTMNEEDDECTYPGHPDYPEWKKDSIPWEYM